MAESPWPLRRNTGLGGRLLGVDDASLVAHPEPAVQSFQDLHDRTGIAGAFRLRQQLQRMQLELHRIVLGHLPAVLEAQDLLQGIDQGPEAGTRTQSIAGEPGSAGCIVAETAPAPRWLRLMLLAPANRSSVTSRS